MSITPDLSEILKNPLIIGYGLGMAMNALHGFLVNLDKEGIATKFGSQLHIIVGVLTFLTSAATLAMNGNLSSLDLSQVQAVLNMWLPMLIGAKGASVSVKKTVAVVDGKKKSVPLR